MNKFIFVKCFLDESRNAEILIAERRRLNQRRKPLSKSERCWSEALWCGYYALHEKATESLHKLIVRNQLLYAWDGTQALEDQEGGAA